MGLLDADGPAARVGSAKLGLRVTYAAMMLMSAADKNGKVSTKPPQPSQVTAVQ
jgi:hypothetical protein